MAPDVPTLPKALNQPGTDITFKLVLQAPRGTPKAVIAKIEKHAAEIMNRPEIRSRLQSDLKAVGSNYAEAEQVIRAERALGAGGQAPGLKLD